MLCTGGGKERTDHDEVTNRCESRATEVARDGAIRAGPPCLLGVTTEAGRACHVAAPENFERGAVLRTQRGPPSQSGFGGLGRNVHIEDALGALTGGIGLAKSTHTRSKP